MNNRYNIGDILINKYNRNYYLVYHIEDGHTYISSLSDNRYRHKYDLPAIGHDFTIVSKA